MYFHSGASVGSDVPFNRLITPFTQLETYDSCSGVNDLKNNIDIPMLLPASMNQFTSSVGDSKILSSAALPGPLNANVIQAPRRSKAYSYPGSCSNNS